MFIRRQSSWLQSVVMFASVIWLITNNTIALAAEWADVKVPDGWRNAPPAVLRDGKGYAWYRCWITVPKEWDDRAAELFLEAVDDAREAFLNGQRLGGSGAFPPAYRSGLGEPERFEIPAGALKAGQPNLLTIRVFQTDENRSGFNVAAPVIFAGANAIRLEGQWQFMPGDDAAWATATGPNPLPAELVFSKIQPAAEVTRTLKKLAGEEGPLSPAESLAKIKVPDDLEIEVVLADPDIGQPLFMSWDERGRLWITQYLQYPTPAGLKMLSRDKFLRSVYDKIPPAPPHHFRGADKITIHEDTNGDGRYDKHKTFVDGLSLMTSFAVGRGGVWVLNPPYLLFYPDRNHDDVPDGDPEVHLEGFGLEDSHSIANSLRWGPDGWLYAAQGSTVSADIKRPGLDKEPTHSLGQLIWRYHPETRRYEVFAEGGGNAFGVEIDTKGRIFSGHNGGDTRGFHYVQGAYLQKGFGKHGALSNPYAFGYFPQMAHHSVPRFTHTFVIYEAVSLPNPYRGRLFGVEPLQGRVVYSEFTPDRSSFKTRDLGHPLTSADSWVRPVDIKTGPDGNLYVADMYEQKIDHASHYQGRIDKTSGRIFRLKTKGGPVARPFDYSGLSNAGLLALLRHDNKWHRQIALQLIADRHDAALVPALLEQLEKNDGQLALESLWAINLSGGLTDDVATRTLAHRDPYVRAWTVRLLCDQRQVAPALAVRLAEVAAKEPHVEVRSQLASSAKRLPATAGLPIVKALLTHSSDTSDIHIPLLLWWAIEVHAETNSDAVVSLFRDPVIWDLTLVRDHILSRVVRRYAAAGSRKNLLTCAQLMSLAPTPEHAAKLMAGFEEAYQGRPLLALPDELIAAIAKSGGLSLALRIRQGDSAAIDEALRLIADEKADIKQRRQVIEILGQVNQPRAIEPLLSVVESAKDDALRSLAITALQSYDAPQIGTAIVKLHNKLTGDVRAVAQALLASRKPWSLEFLKAVTAESIARDDVSAAVVRKMLLFPDEQIAAAVKANWGDVQGATSAEMRQEVERLAAVITTGSGNPYAGRNHYRVSCGKCHQLFEEGGKIGPDLSSYKRDDLKRMLLNVVNPSAEIREGFENYIAVTSDGRTLSGFITDQDKQIVVLKTADGQTLVLAREDIEDLRAVPISIMPDGLLKNLSEQQVRDLFAYLRSTQPLP